MRHTPLGYEIIDGVITVNEEEAEMIRSLIKGYLGGLSFIEAGKAAGIERTHSSIKRILTNKKYLGDGFYPKLIDEETALELEAEIERRSIRLGRNNKPRKEKQVFTPGNRFTLRTAGKKYDDPIAQAEYIYSLIESEEDECKH